MARPVVHVDDEASGADFVVYTRCPACGAELARQAFDESTAVADALEAAERALAEARRWPTHGCRERPA